jgi:dienelactone hydrolase
VQLQMPVACRTRRTQTATEGYCFTNHIGVTAEPKPNVPQLARFIGPFLVIFGISLAQGFQGAIPQRHPFVKPYRLLHRTTFALGQCINRRAKSSHATKRAVDSEIDDDNEGGVLPMPPLDVLPGAEPPNIYSAQDLQQLTVSQLKQQLRLRGERVSGRKSDLVNRLLNLNGQRAVSNTDGRSGEQTAEDVFASTTLHDSAQNSGHPSSSPSGKEFIDVTTYLDPDDVGKASKSTLVSDPDMDETDIADESSTSTEVWGADARILEDEDSHANRPLVVDSLSRTVLEFKGSNQSYVPAVVIATREALKPFLSGGAGGVHRNRTALNIAEATEQRLRELQLQREREAAVPVRMDDTDGLDEGDETGRFANILHREVSDWGKYTATGAQLSAQEVAGVLLLSDVYGAFAPDTTALAEKIAFECQPVIVMVPDLFRGNPWTGPLNGTNDQGQSYEEWRSSHDDLRVRVDIRAAAACLRDSYGVSSIAVWGTCYGGGRALETAATLSSDEDMFIHDVDGKTIGPPPVEPMVVVAWYPARYNAPALFGRRHRAEHSHGAKEYKVAVMGVFAGNDRTPGATQEDAVQLKELLEVDDSVVDHMVKIFPGQEHGFAHLGLSQPKQPHDGVERFVDEEFGGAGRLSVAEGEAEVACLLSTAFMETYTRVFMPTVGPPISLDEYDSEWGRELTIKDLKETRNRDVRVELKEAIDNFVEEPLLSGPRIDPTDEAQEEALARLLRSMQDPSATGPFKVTDDDDLPTIYKKLLSSDENFQIF